MVRLPEDGTKTREERLIGIPELTVRDVSALWRPGMDLSECILSGNHRRSFAHAARLIGYRRTPTLRDLRHTFATLSLQYGGDLRATQEAMGHRELQSTQRYLSSTTSRTVAAGLVVEQVFAPTLPPPTPGFDPQMQPPPPVEKRVGASD